MKYSTIITYGTFDMFHLGHVRLLKQLKEMADKVIVGVSTDEFNLGKGKRSLIPFEQRAEILESCKYVDTVIPERTWDQKQHDIDMFRCDAFAIGNDWEGKFDFLKSQCDVIYLPRTAGISTTELKSSLNRFLSIPKEDLLAAFSVIEQLRNDLF